jgi:hypothetical protein
MEINFWDTHHAENENRTVSVLALFEIAADHDQLGNHTGL